MPGAIKEIKDIENDYLVTGDAAMTWVASNQINSIVNAAGREIKVAPVPRMEKDGAYGMIRTVIPDALRIQNFRTQTGSCKIHQLLCKRHRSK